MLCFADEGPETDIIADDYGSCLAISNTDRVKTLHCTPDALCIPTQGQGPWLTILDEFLITSSSHFALMGFTATEAVLCYRAGSSAFTGYGLRPACQVLQLDPVTLQIRTEVDCHPTDRN